MKTNRYIYLFCIILVCSYACEQKAKIDQKKPVALTEERETELLDLLMDKVEEVEELCENELLENKSLLWERTGKDNSELIQVTAYNNQSGSPYKIIEKYNNGENPGQQGQRVYYFNEGRLFAYYHQYDKWLNDTYAQLIDEQHFFDEESGDDILSRKRTSDAIEDLNDSPWESVTPEEPNLDLAQAVLESKKPFETHFLSFIESEYGLFLLLGEPKETDEPRYQTAVAVNPAEPFIQDLIQNKEKYKFKKLAVSFSFEGGGSQPLFAVVQFAEWVEDSER